MDFSNIRIWQDKILNYLENNGYPFAKVYLDSLQMGIQTAVLVSPNDANEAGQVSARLKGRQRSACIRLTVFVFLVLPGYLTTICSAISISGMEAPSARENYCGSANG